MIIDKYKIGTAHIFIIAEIGMNHNGNYKNATKLIDQAIKAGADCVKFQMRNLNELYSKSALDITSTDLGTQYTLGLLKKFELSFDDYKRLSEYSRKKGILFLCTPWDKSSVDKLEKLNVKAYKIASADLTNIDLIDYIISKKKPIILSTGMSNEDEIKDTIKFLKTKKAVFSILHCNSTYPAPLKDINLNYLKNLEKYNVPVGYSGHERGIATSLGAVAIGAKIIERHITLDRNMEGPDHAASLEFDDFELLVKGIRELQKSIGVQNKRSMTQGEMINRENLSKSIFAKKSIKKGEQIKKDMLEIKSPGQGLSPQYLTKIIGKKPCKDIEKNKPIFITDISGKINSKKIYKFNRKWGIPVRFHDLKTLLNNLKPSLVEFHLSFNDLNEDISKLITKKYNCEFVVHAPELFKNDHLLDLCTPNKKYRNESINNLQNVIDLTVKLKNYFININKPKIIINAGGFTRDDFLDPAYKTEYYQNLINSLNKLKSNEVEIIPQNMAPFPWHFGGQRYQNLLVLPEEIINFCKSTGMRICHDISHSYMTCKKYKLDHIDFTEKIAPLVTHYHIADAIGIDGEGLQIGIGDINFKKILQIINKYSPEASFIPEVWQGHKNNGEGFWIAFKKLENKL